MNLTGLITYLQRESANVQKLASNPQGLSNLYKQVENALHQVYDQELSNQGINSEEHYVLDQKSFNNNIAHGDALTARLKNDIAYLRTLMNRNPSHSASYQQQIVSLQPELTQINPQLCYRGEAVRKNNIVIPTHLHTINQNDVLQFITKAMNIIEFVNKDKSDVNRLNQLNNNSSNQPAQPQQQPITQNYNQQKPSSRGLFANNTPNKSKKQKKHKKGGFFGKIKQFASYMNSRPSESSSSMSFNINNSSTPSTELRPQNNGMNQMSSNLNNTMTMNSFSNSSQLTKPNLKMDLGSQFSNSTNTSFNMYSNTSSNDMNQLKYNPAKDSFEKSQSSTGFDSVQPKSINIAPTQNSSFDDESLYNSVTKSSASNSADLNNNSDIDSEKSQLSQAYADRSYAQSVNTSLRKQMAKMTAKSSQSSSIPDIDPNSGSSMNLDVESTSSNSSDNSSKSEVNYKALADILSNNHTSSSASSSSSNTASASNSRRSSESDDETSLVQSILSKDAISSKNTASDASSQLSASSSASSADLHGSAVAILAQVDQENDDVRKTASSAISSVGKQNNSLIAQIHSQSQSDSKVQASLITSASSAKTTLKRSADLASYQSSKASVKSEAILKASALNRYKSIKNSDSKSAKSAMASTVNSASKVSQSASKATKSASSATSELAYALSTQNHKTVMYKQFIKYLNKYYQAQIDNMIQPALNAKNLHDASNKTLKKLGSDANFDWSKAKTFSSLKDFLKFVNQPNHK